MAWHSSREQKNWAYVTLDNNILSHFHCRGHLWFWGYRGRCCRNCENTFLLLPRALRSITNLEHREKELGDFCFLFFGKAVAGVQRFFYLFKVEEIRLRLRRGCFFSSFPFVWSSLTSMADRFFKWCLSGSPRMNPYGVMPGTASKMILHIAVTGSARIRPLLPQSLPNKINAIIAIIGLILIFEPTI